MFTTQPTDMTNEHIHNAIGYRRNKIEEFDTEIMVLEGELQRRKEAFREALIEPIREVLKEIDSSKNEEDVILQTIVKIDNKISQLSARISKLEKGKKR